MSPELKTRLTSIATSIERQLKRVEQPLPEGKLADMSFNDLQIMFISITVSIAHINTDLNALKQTIEDDWS